MRTQFICLVIMLILLCSFASAQWLQTNGPTGGNISSFAVSGTNLFAGTNSGVFLSTNNGTSWTSVSKGLTFTDVFALAVSGENLFAGTGISGGPDGDVFLSTNNGTSWTSVSTGLYNKRVLALAVSGTNLFAGILAAGVFLSTDNGASWAKVLSTISVYALVASGTNIFAGTDGGDVFLSTNNGTSWVNTLTGVRVRALAASGTNLFAGTWSGVFLSIDSGASWTQVNACLANVYVNALAVSGDKLFAGTGVNEVPGGGVFLSTNNGTSWTQVNAGLTVTRVLALAVSGENLFAGTYDSGVWRCAISDIIVPITLYSFSAVPLSQNGYVMIEWKTMSETNNYGFVVEKDTTRVLQVFAAIPGSFTPGQGTTLKAHTYTFVDNNVTQGKWAYRLKQIDLDGAVHVFEPKMVDFTTTEAGNDPALPTVSALQQNYPNPFNPSTTIRYGLPNKSAVRLSVFNTLGQNVSTLVNGEQEAGYHEVKFDAAGLSSGVYFYRLESGAYVQTRKLLLIR